ncbi:hypothetical protein QL285_094068 [Trifolium repens]|nr:hypothetical protein QL285_094068 [Trifolium repens]
MQQLSKTVCFFSHTRSLGLQQTGEWSQQTGEWSPRFWLQATFLSKSYFHTWAIVLQRIYHQKQLITVGKKNISDTLTDPYIRDHYEWTVLPI